MEIGTSLASELTMPYEFSTGIKGAPLASKSPITAGPTKDRRRIVSVTRKDCTKRGCTRNCTCCTRPLTKRTEPAVEDEESDSKSRITSQTCQKTQSFYCVQPQEYNRLKGDCLLSDQLSCCWIFLVVAGACWETES